MSNLSFGKGARLLSGIDERPRTKIPVCPKCGREPDFWILNLAVPKCIWLFSERYLNKYPQFKKVTSSCCSPTEWVDVRSIKCGHDGNQTTTNHNFHRDFVENANIVQKVLEQTKYYIDIGRVRRS